MTEIAVSMVGDIHVDRPDPASIFRHVRPLLAGADVNIGDLEIIAATTGTPERAKPYSWANWRTHPTNLAALQNLFSIVSVASNHTLDFGEAALLECLSHLDAAGIQHCGSGSTLAEAEKPAVVEAGDCRVAALAYTTVFLPGWEATEERPGLATIRVYTRYEPPRRFFEQPGTPAVVRTTIEPADVQRLRVAIGAARRQADVVVVALHWGLSEQYRLVAEYQPELGRLLIDAGADIVYGFGPHVIQGVEVYQGKPILYSVGNFAFDLRLTEYFDFEGLVARAQVRDGRLQALYLIPIQINATNEPVLCNDATAREILGRVQAHSRGYGTRFSEAEVAGRLALQVVL